MLFQAVFAALTALASVGGTAPATLQVNNQNVDGYCKNKNSLITDHHACFLFNGDINKGMKTAESIYGFSTDDGRGKQALP